MSELASIQSCKRKALAEDPDPGWNGESRRETKRVRISLRAVVGALSAWAIDADHLTYFDTSIQSRGGTADIMKASLVAPQSIGTADLDKGSVCDVAVKKFRFSDDAEKRAQVARFANELSLLSELRHENIIRLLGMVENTETGVPSIVMPWEANGNIKEFVRSRDWAIPERLALIYDVVCGVEYLHSRDPPICHGDLKSLNVLVSSECRALITDFGSARKLGADLKKKRAKRVIGAGMPAGGLASRDASSALAQLGECGTFITLTGPVYTLRWAAPEVLEDEEFGLASDMWAFGWICWEIMTGNIPFNDLRAEVAIVLRVTRGDLPLVTSNEHVSQVRALCAMMTRCWAMDPKHRPTAIECEKTIRWMDRIALTKRTADTPESHSTEVLCALGYTNIENQNIGEAKNCFQRALSIARSAGNALAAANAILGRATVYRLQSEYSEAEASYTEAQGIYAGLGAEESVADAIWGLGEVFSSRKDYPKAEGLYTEAREIYSRLGVEKKVADAIWGLGEVYRMRKDYTKAEASYNEAREIYTAVGAEKKIADAIWSLGKVYRLRNENSKAEELYTEAKGIYSRLGAEKDVADVIWGLGEVYRIQKEYAKAESSYTNAREIYARLGAVKDVADTIWGLGEIYRLQENYTMAEASYTEAREIYARLGAEEDLADVIWCLGDVYSSRNEYSKAQMSYTEARGIFSLVGAERKAADAIWGLGQVYRMRKDYSKAETLYGEALEIYSRLGAEKDVADVLWGLGEVHRMRKEYEKAESSYISSRDIYARLGAKKDVADAFWALGEVYRMRKEYSKAKEALNEAQRIYVEIEYPRGVATTLSSIAKLRGRE